MKKVISLVMLMFVVGIVNAQIPYATRDFGVIPNKSVVKEHYGTTRYGGGQLTSCVQFEIKSARPVAVIPLITYPNSIRSPLGMMYIFEYRTGRTVMSAPTTQNLWARSLPPGVYVVYAEVWIDSCPPNLACANGFRIHFD